MTTGQTAIERKLELIEQRLTDHARLLARVEQLLATDDRIEQKLEQLQQQTRDHARWLAGAGLDPGATQTRAIAKTSNSPTTIAAVSATGGAGLGALIRWILSLFVGHA